MLLTAEQTGGPRIFSLRRHNCYLAVEVLQEFNFERQRGTTAIAGVIEKLTFEVREFDIDQLARALGQPAGETRQEHASLILLACMGGRLFEWLDKVQDGHRIN